MYNKKHTFYREEDGRWYINLPEYIDGGGNKEDLEMVAGADVMLDILSKNKDRVDLHISTSENSYPYTLIKQDDNGNYLFYDSIKEQNTPVWLCNVTTWVFGYYPEMIYLKL